MLYFHTKEPHNQSQRQVLKVWEVAVCLAVDGGVFVGVFLCCLFSRGVSWMRYRNLLGQFLRVFLSTFLRHGWGLSEFCFDNLHGTYRCCTKAYGSFYCLSNNYHFSVHIFHFLTIL